ncbi:MAG: ABC transporter permease [Alphaproteobacteria bacterium]|nr:ABC transporter permease [Alphaproteobacteria bacterium]
MILSHPSSPLAGIVALFAHRRLIIQLAGRDVAARYRGSMLGMGWSLLNPLLLLAVYTFVFSTVFQARFGGGAGESTFDFALMLFAGMIVHGFFAECLSRAPTIILGNVNFVKKVVFPLEIYPAVILLSTLFHSAISLAVLMTFAVATQGGLPPTALLAPIVLAPFMLLTLGLCWFLASLGVFMRDIAQTIGLFMTVLMFLSPIFYPLSALPAWLQPYLALNPLTLIIESLRGVLLLGNMPDWRGLGIYSAIAGMIACAGFWWFQKTRRGFADVL